MQLPDTGIVEAATEPLCTRKGASVGPEFPRSALKLGPCANPVALQPCRVRQVNTDSNDIATKVSGTCETTEGADEFSLSLFQSCADRDGTSRFFLQALKHFIARTRDDVDHMHGLTHQLEAIVEEQVWPNAPFLYVDAQHTHRIVAPIIH